MTAVLGGAEGWKGIKCFGDSKLDWLRQFSAFDSGIPSVFKMAKNGSPLMVKRSEVQVKIIMLMPYT